MRLLHVFFDVDLRCDHDGLGLVAKKQKLLVDKLEPGQFILFINSRRNRLKMYGANNVLAYLRLPQGKIEERTLRYIPDAFQAKGKIDYNSALKKVLLEELKPHITSE